MEQSNNLDDWLAAARSELPERAPDLLAEQQLLARVREIKALRSVAATRIEAPPRRERRAGLRHWVFNWRVSAFAGATALAVAISIVLLAPDAPQRNATVRTPFLALVASEAIAAEPSALVVSAQVPAAALSDYGLPLDPARADEPIRAEFLLSPTGLVLAVRFAE